jgi:hypothetical protein
MSGQIQSKEEGREEEGRGRGRLTVLPKKREVKAQTRNVEVDPVFAAHSCQSKSYRQIPIASIMHSGTAHNNIRAN